MTPILSYTIEYQARHHIPPVYMDIKHNEWRGLWVLSCTRSVSFFWNPRSPVLAVQSCLTDHQTCTGSLTWRHHWMIMTMSHVLSVLFVLGFFHFYSILEAGEDGDGNTNRQEQSVCKMGILQLAEYQRRPINPSVILLQDICSYGVYVV